MFIVMGPLYVFHSYLSLGTETVSMTPGRRFMMDLLVGSLMADGGLESALHAAIKAEIRQMESQREKDVADPSSDGDVEEFIKEVAEG